VRENNNGSNIPAVSLSISLVANSAAIEYSDKFNSFFSKSSSTQGGFL